MTIDRDRLKSICEALIFVSEEALPFRKINAVLEGVGAPELRDVLSELMEQWQQQDCGIILVEVAEGYQFRTRPENTEWIKMLIKYKPSRLSKPALETLAIIAYNQPATKPEIEAIRGVDCSSSLSQLLEKGLIKIMGRKEVPGKPFIYGTTRKFLEVMGLKDLAALPTLKEIEESDILLLDDFENQGGENGEKKSDREDSPEEPAEDDAPELDELESAAEPTEEITGDEYPLDDQIMYDPDESANEPEPLEDDDEPGFPDDEQPEFTDDDEPEFPDDDEPDLPDNDDKEDTEE